ncbi:MAG: hypothetical protein KJ949_00690 [Nanoarchaeota archaeon]|nr:hypothetical protein [Nanoarchaeota archaeon]
MLNPKEIASILAITIILGFTISLISSTTAFLYAAGSILIIILLTTFAKKIASSYFDSGIEIKIWEIKKYGFKPHRKFRKSFPAGAFFPIIITAITAGFVNWLACLTFDVKAKVHRAAKRHGYYSFSEMTEHHIGLIAAAGIFLNIILAILGYLFNFPTFAELNIYYAFFNMLPISELDGNKIFFGSLVLWCFLATLVLIGVCCALFII